MANQNKSETRVPVSEVVRARERSPAIKARDTSLSPDGRRLVYDIGDGGSKGDLWIRDLTRGVSSRFTFDAAGEVNAKWSPDGRQIVYTSKAKGAGDLYVKDASGTREAEPLLVDKDEKDVSDWSPDGKYILYTSRNEASRRLGHPGSAHRRRQEAVAHRQDAVRGAVGHILARWEVHRVSVERVGPPRDLRPRVPGGRNKWQVSTEGGIRTLLARRWTGAVLSPGTRVMSVPVQIASTFTAGTPVPLFQTRFATSVVRGRYRPTPDGQRFLVLGPSPERRSSPLRSCSTGRQRCSSVEGDR